MILYENNLEYLLDELRRIDLRVRLFLEKKIKIGSDEFKGLYISESEVNAILQMQSFGLNEEIHSDQELEKIKLITNEINKKKSESIIQGKELRLHTLSDSLHLNHFENDVLLICLAPELDLRYEKLYSYLQDDVTKKRPSVDLVIRLLSSNIQERYKARQYFSSEAPLIRNRLIYLTGDDQPLISRSIKVDERIINYLIGSDEIDPNIRKLSAIIKPKKSFDDLIGDNKRMLAEITVRAKSCPIVFYFFGPYGTGKKMTAETLCRELGTSLLIIDSKSLKSNDYLDTLNFILREALLQRASVYFDGFNSLFEKDAGVSVTNILRNIDVFKGFVFLSGEQQWEPAGIIRNHGFASLEFSIPSFEMRKRLWKSFLNGSSRGDMDIMAISSKFKFSGGQIKDSIFSARNIAAIKNPDQSMLSMSDIFQGCKMQSNRNLSIFAKKIDPRYKWEDIILPKDVKDQLKEVAGYIKFKGIVYTEWGFDKKLSLGKGLNVLFTGPSGTGKTMAAEIIARETGLDIYRIDLSFVISKYIGETEKNLRNIFNEAETSNAILFFDEADALFGKRSEVKDSHDRYANIEINYLLQKVEEYEGIVILASNFRKNIDEAFLRRIHFSIEFPLPDEEYREKIWKTIFPRETPVDYGLDVKFLSKLKIAGGNIKNIALSAAFLAAADSGVVKMEHLIKATRREFQKIGKLCIKGDFGKYYELLEEDLIDE